MTLKHLVYVSYAWGDDTEAGIERELIVDELCEALEKYDGIIVGRDKRRQKIGDSIEGFAADIARADIVLAVVSRKYLRSYHCMVEELHQTYHRVYFEEKEFQKKVCLLLLDDGRSDFDNVSQELIDHWHELYEKLYSKLSRLDPGKTKSAHGWAALEKIGDMKSRMFDMFKALKDIVMPRGYTEIKRNDFEELRDLIRRRLEEWRQFREDRSGFIPEIGEGLLDDPKLETNRLNHQFLALVLGRGEVLVDDPKWFQRECPWEVSSYTWESFLHSTEEGGYQPVDFQEDKHDAALRVDIGAYVIAQESVSTSSSTADQRCSFRDLLQEAVDWMDRNGFGGLLELFVPTELLVFDWSAIKIRGKAEYDPDDCFFERHPYVLRSVDRFHDIKLKSQLKGQFPQKFAKLTSSNGQWIAGDAAVNLAKLKESETKPELVALKCLSPLDPDPLMRLRWHRRVVEAMVPLALWWRSPDAGFEDERQSHLDQAYEGLLSGHNNGDQVHMDCHQLERLPRLRRSALSDPLTKDLVLLFDRPDRHPWPESDQPQGSPVRSA